MSKIPPQLIELRLHFVQYFLFFAKHTVLRFHHDKMQDYNGSKPFEQGHLIAVDLTLENNEAN